MSFARELFRLAVLGAVNHQITHIVVAGSIFAETQAVLLRYVADHPNEPLGDLPNSFSDEVAIILTRTR